MGELIRYDAACKAVAEAKSVDEVKDIRDKAEAMRIYARQANNRDLEADCGEIRIRAEIRLGEMLAEQKATVGLNTGRAGAGRPNLGGTQVEPPKDSRPTLADAGIDKKLSSRAQKLAAVPEKERENLISSYRHRVREEGKRVSMDLLKAGDKAQRRAEREAELAEATERASEALGIRQYNVILADPAWRFEPYSRVTGLDRAADNHYPTTPLQELMDLDVPGASAKDCVLFLWATAPMLLEALALMRAWGFNYKSHCVWVKDKIGTGYWFRNQHELLLVGTKGNIPAPAPGTQSSSIISAPLGRHSEKPSIVHEIIEKIYPNVPKIEMFARESRYGWDAWGNETCS